MRKYLFTSLCLSALTGCATQLPMHTVRSVPAAQKPSIVRSQAPQIPSETVRSQYHQWHFRTEYSASAREYVRSHWSTTEENGERIVARCIRHTETALNNHSEAGWTYVTGDGYQKKQTPMHGALPCWSHAANTFQSYTQDAAQNAGEDNPLTQYDAALTQWTTACENMAVSKDGLRECTSHALVGGIQDAKKNVQQYLAMGD